VISEWWLVLFALVMVAAGVVFFRRADRFADAVSRTWGMDAATSFAAGWYRAGGFLLGLVGVLVAASALVEIAGV
jgi:hypothetical protein